MYKSIITLLVITSLFISGCGATKETLANEESFEPGLFQENDLAFYDVSNNIKISMGMNKAEVEKLLGQPTGTVNFLGLFEYSGLKVHYKADKVNGIVIDDNTQDFGKFMTPRSIKFGSNMEDVIDKYGNNVNKNELTNDISLTYVVEKVNGEYKYLNTLAEASNQDNAYTLSMNIDNASGIYFIMMADYEYSTNPTGK